MADDQALRLTRLATLSPGQGGHVHSICVCNGVDAMSLRLLELGFDEGIEVELLHTGPFGGNPLAVRVGNATVALRRAEADRVRLVA
jgi:Fe2+ transport system protein FeoA